MSKVKRAPVGLMFAEDSSDSSSDESNEQLDLTPVKAKTVSKPTSPIKTRSSDRKSPASQSKTPGNTIADSLADILQPPSTSFSTTMDSTRQKLAAPVFSRDANTNKLLSTSAVMQPGFETEHEVPSKISRRKAAMRRKEARGRTAGDKWFGLPATEMDEAKKRDLELLQMRDAMDPSRFYRQSDRKVLPKYFQVGTIVEHAADFYHSRVPKKQRKRTLVEEVLADRDALGYQKRKFEEVDAERRWARRGAFTKPVKSGRKKSGFDDDD